MKKEIQDFCRKAGITEDQFTGKEEVGGSLWLNGLTSIPEGFNPTVGGDLWLDGLTSEQRKKVQIKRPDPDLIENLRRNKLLFWKDGKYVKADGMFTEVISKHGNVYKVKKIHSVNEFYLVTNGKIHAHGETVEKAKEDFRFKVLSEKLKKDPIKEDTIITINHYRVVTGACELGVRNWMESVFTPEQRKEVSENGIKASELLPILKKHNAYGLDRFNRLITF